MTDLTSPTDLVFTGNEGNKVTVKNVPELAEAVIHLAKAIVAVADLLIVDSDE